MLLAAASHKSLLRSVLLLLTQSSFFTCCFHQLVDPMLIRRPFTYLYLFKYRTNEKNHGILEVHKVIKHNCIFQAHWSPCAHIMWYLYRWCSFKERHQRSQRTPIDARLDGKISAAAPTSCRDLFHYHEFGLSRRAADSLMPVNLSYGEAQILAQPNPRCYRNIRLQKVHASFSTHPYVPTFFLKNT